MRAYLVSRVPEYVYPVTTDRRPELLRIMGLPDFCGRDAAPKCLYETCIVIDEQFARPNI